MSKSWFEQWFNTNYYHILYCHRNENEAQSFLTKLIRYLQLPTKSKIIDIGCGRGRHAKFLSELDYIVTGIDIAEKNIEFAKQFEDENLTFYCHDKRNVFKENEFDLGLNLFTSFGYLEKREELQEALISMTKNLKANGMFVLDYLNAEKIKESEFTSESLINEGIEFKISKEIKNKRVLKHIEVIDSGNSKEFLEEVHLITKSDFIEFFNLAQLNVLHTFGDYSLNEFDSSTSDRLILIAQKK